MKPEQKVLEHRLAYGRGLTPGEWKVLIPLRKEQLIKKGLNPDHYNVSSRDCSKRFGY